MNRVSIELYKHEWNEKLCGNASRRRRENGKILVNFDYQNVNSLCSLHHCVNSAR